MRLLQAASVLALGPGLFGCASAPADEGPGSGGGTNASTGGVSGAEDTLDVLAFSRTVAFRHASIPAAIAALERLADERDWRLVASEESALFEAGMLETFDVVVFLLTSGDVLDPAQQAAFEAFVRSGKGYVGVHSASDTEYDWPWYGELVGAYFTAHPDVQAATIVVEDPVHPATSGLPSPWTRTDEWYGFDRNPRGSVEVLLTVDEASYQPGQGSLGNDHPIAWVQEFDGGRSFYTALGHTAESYSEPAFLIHLAGGIEWAAGIF